MGPMTSATAPRDHIDLFLDRLEDIPGLDRDVEGIVDRINQLEQDGLIRRVRDPDDRRGVKIELTDAGRRAWTDSTSAQARKEALVASALKKSEQQQLNSLLRKLM